MRLWLDDERQPPDNGGWLWVQSADAAIEALRTGAVSFASLDHDLGDTDPHDPEDEPNLSHNEKTGYTVVLWMAEHGVWPQDGIVVHSWNKVGAARMIGVVNRYGPYATRCRHIPFQIKDQSSGRDSRNRIHQGAATEV